MPRHLRTLRRASIDTLESRQMLAAVELISNGQFANDDHDWAATGAFYANDRFQTYRSSPGYAYLAGSTGTFATSNDLSGTLQQTITLPSTTATANLQFWYRTASETGAAQSDSLAVRVRNTAGAVLETLTTLYNQPTMSAYAPSPMLSLASYAGQTIVLSFEGQTDATAATVFRIDDVSLQATSSTVPAIPAPTLAYPGVPGTTALPAVNTPVPGFTWNAVSGAVGYGLTLERLNATSGAYSVVFDSDANPNTSGRPITGTNFTVPMSLSSGTYRWSVRAYDDAVTTTSAAPPLYFALNASGFTRALGIDVSRYQTISASAWQTIKTNGTTNTTADDTAFVWAKASQGVGSPDGTYATKAVDARAAGIPFGAYHYATPWNGGTTLESMRADATAEANDFYSRISSTLLPGNLVPMLDFEDPDVTQSPTLLSHWVNAFCEHLSALSKLTPVVYSGQYYAYAHLNPSVLRYPLWVAQYSTAADPQTANPNDPDDAGVRSSTTPWPTWSIWQWTSSGTVAGYNAGIDRDVFNGDVAALQQFKIRSATLGDIFGSVFDDANSNGVRDSGEALLGGRTVFLDADGDNVLDPGERQTTTSSLGGSGYEFTKLPAGTYRIAVVAAPGQLATTATTQLVQLGAGQFIYNRDFGSRAIDATPPTLASSRFNHDSVARTITLVFSEDVAATLTNADAMLTNLTTGATVATTLAYSAATRTATFTPAALVNGDHRLTIAAGNITDAAGNASATMTVEFFWLAGDINRDRTTNFSDLVILAQNYNQTGRTYATGDLTGDGIVNFSDLVVLAQSYNASLPTLAASPPAALAVAKATAKRKPSADVLA